MTGNPTQQATMDGFMDKVQQLQQCIFVANRARSRTLNNCKFRYFESFKHTLSQSRVQGGIVYNM